tara:strand:- start:9 stop:581 length:573 start_codon:yes stop_codon:yes gene_type:complete
MGKKYIKGKVKELRGAYGKPLGNNLDIVIEKEDLLSFGELCVKYIEEEARAAAQYSKALPKDEKFFKSFRYVLKGSSTIKIVSDWPWIGIYQDLQKKDMDLDKDAAFGKPRPFRLSALTQQSGVDKVPMVDKQTGEVIVRTTPLKVADAWIHPGIARHTFINKGLKRARDEFTKGLLERKLAECLGGEHE